MSMTEPNNFIRLRVIKMMPFDFLLSTNGATSFLDAAIFYSIGKKGFTLFFQRITRFLLNDFAFPRFKNFISVFPIKLTGVFGTFWVFISFSIIFLFIGFSRLADFISMKTIVDKNKIASTFFTFVPALRKKIDFFNFATFGTPFGIHRRPPIRWMVIKLTHLYYYVKPYISRFGKEWSNGEVGR